MSPWIRGVAATGAVLLGLTFAAPCTAGEASPQGHTGGAPSLRAITDAKVAAIDTAKALRLAQAEEATAGESKPFFKSRKGVLAAVLMAGGVTWAIVSRSKDAVHSPAR